MSRNRPRNPLVVPCNHLHPEDKQALEGEELVAFMRQAKSLGHCEFHGISICVFNHPAYPTFKMFRMASLGHTLNIIYKFDNRQDKENEIHKMLDELFDDFSHYVVHERDEFNATSH